MIIWKDIPRELRWQLVEAAIERFYHHGDEDLITTADQHGDDLRNVLDTEVPVAVFDGGAWQYPGIVDDVFEGTAEADIPPNYAVFVDVPYADTGLLEFPWDRIGIIDFTKLPIPGALWLHVGSGRRYLILGYDRLQLGGSPLDGRLMVRYREPGYSAPWTRPLAEFLDGRFACIAPPSLDCTTCKHFQGAKECGTCWQDSITNPGYYAGWEPR